VAGVENAGGRDQQAAMAEDARLRVNITASIRRSSLFWMVQDSWTCRGGVLVGLVFAVSAPTTPDPVALASLGLAFVAVCLVALPFYTMWLAGYSALVGRTVHLVIDGRGVRGWPVGEDNVRSWGEARRVWRRPGVVVVQYSRWGMKPGARLAIPWNGLDPGQRTTLRELLMSKGLVKGRGSLLEWLLGCRW
jgi:hypothetical protein